VSASDGCFLKALRGARAAGTNSQVLNSEDVDEIIHREFVVPTPLGNYNQDWTVVIEDDENLYLVRETKSTHELPIRTKDQYFQYGPLFDRRIARLFLSFNPILEQEEVYC
jgi:hypothetical protein